MARTGAGRVLTEEHRRAQMQVRAAAIRDYMQIWPLWQGDDESFNQLVLATIPLIRAYHSLSASFASSYFDSFRRAERVAGSATPRLPGDVDVDQVTAGLQATGRIAVRRALLSGQTAERAMQTAFVTTSGSVTRQALAGGRDTLVLSTGEDEQATGWARVTDNEPCPFCVMLASRGPVYRGEDTAEFEAHDHCACTAEPAYDESEWPGRAREFSDLWDRAQREAAADGDLERGTSNDALNALRRLLAAERN